MELSYDPRHNIAYIRLLPKAAQVESIKLSEEIVVDLSPDGKVYGIELLNAKEQLLGGLTSGLTLVNEADGSCVHIPLVGAAA